MKDEIYRVVFETVRQERLAEFTNADPHTHSNVSQVVRNSQIPDDAWYEVTGRATDNPWGQFYTLQKWDREDKEFVRKVRLERLVMDNPVWEPYERPAGR